MKEKLAVVYLYFRCVGFSLKLSSSVKLMIASSYKLSRKGLNFKFTSERKCFLGYKFEIILRIRRSSQEFTVESLNTLII
ncbi:hypothetical protein BpHYR1_039083 [Brachionus plicatilis]|uniref:Uncharacterized protein n=1 Tax=Brachionus plicatilis TaxID=10195 RepID=A0A3M7RZ33_BRAPC|nr:hypothetical protein BpHYR1_039083 [Brachionus plicatilis]